jgi:prolipoprotein diacylglyceryl transferase
MRARGIAVEHSTRPRMLSSTVMSSPGAIAFQVGPVVIRWYGILMAASILVALWIAHRQARKEGLPADDIITAGQWAVLVGLVGARLYEVAFNWDYYGQFPRKIFAVWEGGLAIHGGLIVGPLFGAWLGWKWGLPVLRGLDVTAPAFAIGQAIGRWGNFFNEEAFGQPTNLPWKLYISPPHRPQGYQAFEYFHPTFLYESLWCLLAFAVVVWADRRWRLGHGRVLALYVMAYTAGRGWIETLRIDTVQLDDVAGLRLNVWTSIVLFVLAAAWFVYAGRRWSGRERDVYAVPRDAASASVSPAETDGSGPGSL